MKKEGFTLIEILIVIIFISILGVLGFFGFISYQESVRISGEVGELVDDLYYARQLSIIEQVHHGIRFNFEENYYQVIRYDEEEEIIKEKIFPPGMEIDSPDINLEPKFTLFGAVFKGGEIILSGGDRLKVIQIKPSGFIHVQRPDLN